MPQAYRTDVHGVKGQSVKLVKFFGEFSTAGAGGPPSGLPSLWQAPQRGDVSISRRVARSSRLNGMHAVRAQLWIS